jgi:hypothetical protein
MRNVMLLLVALFVANTAYSQSLERKLRSFDKVVVSPRINLVLIPGNVESIRIDYSGVDEEKIIIDQKGKKLRVYLDDARILDIGVRHRNMFDRHEQYRHASVTAYVTFKHLTMIETRGEGDVSCDGRISSKKLKIKAYGETNIRLAYLDAATVRARLYGENTLTIREGDAGHISYKMYGTNKIDTRGLTSVTSSATIYGEGSINLHTTEEVHVTSFGEPSLYVSGGATISKGIVMGRTNIRRN